MSSKYNTRYVIEDCHEFAHSKKGECLETEYKNCSSLMGWRCEFGHEWTARFGDLINKNSWCGRCYGNERLAIKDANDEAEKRGWKCLSVIYKNNSDPLEWECQFGHRWFASLNNIKKGNGCRYCCGKHWHSLDEAKETASQHNCDCLSEEYKDCDSKLRWKCLICGEEWNRSLYDACYYDRWCGRCSQNIKSKSQRLLMETLEDMLSTRAIENHKGFDWLKTEKLRGKQELDIWFPDIKLAVEYDGEQHFIPTKFSNRMNAEDALNDIQIRDAMKNEKIKQHPEDVRYFVRFNYKEKLTKEYIINKLKECGVPIEANNDLQPS